MKKVAIIMGSKSDGPTMEHAAKILKDLGVSYKAYVVSAHRTPDFLAQFSETAHEEYDIIIAGAGGAAHLPGMVAAHTILPVIGVPVKSSTLSGVDSLYSIVQMPGGVPVATMAIGIAGAKNAGLLAAQILALHDNRIYASLKSFREAQTNDVLHNHRNALEFDVEFKAE